ncbi:MAG: hypothetical protein HYV96_11875 [Opitutae bacterium]|nr:hypothetical protein [Opitutae bacterium]
MRADLRAEHLEFVIAPQRLGAGEVQLALVRGLLGFEPEIEQAPREVDRAAGGEADAGASVRAAAGACAATRVVSGPSAT